MSDIERARELLTGSATCVLVRDNTVYISHKSGIAPMLDYLGAGISLEGFSVADRIVGKAAAMLFVRAGIKEAYGEVMSRSGSEFLESHGVGHSSGSQVDIIINRMGTGMCPMEQTVLGIDDFRQAFCALSAKRAALRKNNQPAGKK